MMVDSTTVSFTEWTPVGVWPAPITFANAWDLEAMGETHYSQSNVPGSDVGGTATVFQPLQGQRWSDDQFAAMPCSMVLRVTSSRYGLNGSGSGGCSAFSIFTRSGA